MRDVEDKEKCKKADEIKKSRWNLQKILTGVIFLLAPAANMLGASRILLVA